MRFLTYVFKSINLLNLLLVAVVASLVSYLVYPLLNMKVTYKPPAVAQQTPAKEEKPAPVQSPPASDYMVVAEQNIFHPERKIPPEAKDEKALPKPEIYLYGTLLTDNMRLAYIEDRKSPQSTPGRGKRQTVVKQGDVISGFTLKSVETDRIVLTRGEEQMIVYLNDAKKQREVVTAPTGQRGALPGSTPIPTPGPTPVGPTRTPSAVAMPAAPPASAQGRSPASVAPGVTPQSTPASPDTTSSPMRQPSRTSRTNPATRAAVPQQQ
jgi:hypothetical protein